MHDESPRLGVIPARADSSRFPCKVIASIHGKPMIQHVWEAARRARKLDSVVIATDDPEVASVARGFGAEVVLTGTHASGTDRVAAVARATSAGLIVNLQGDEPLLDPAWIDALVDVLDRDPACDLATLAVRRVDPSGLADPNIVKLVASGEDQALYFSREPLRMGPGGEWAKHIGIYAFRRALLLRYSGWEPVPLERAERLEQLRALHHGVRIRVVWSDRDTVSVDVPDDIARVERWLAGATPGGIE